MPKLEQLKAEIDAAIKAPLLVKEKAVNRVLTCLLDVLAEHEERLTTAEGGRFE